MAAILEGITSLKDRISGSVTRATPEVERFHQDLVKISSQLSSTEMIINNNMQELTEISKTDDKTAAALSTIVSSLEDRRAIEQKILRREAITNKEAAQLVKAFETVTNELDNLGAELDINLGSVVKNLKSQVTDSRIDRESRRDILRDVITVAEERDVDSESLKDLKTIMSQNLNFSDEQNEVLKDILDSLAEDPALEAKRIKTLSELNDAFDSATLTQGELKDVLEQSTKDGDTFRDKFLKNAAIFSRGQELKAGLASFAFGALGLGGLDQALGISGIVSGLGFGSLKKGIGGVVAKLGILSKGIVGALAPLALLTAKVAAVVGVFTLAFKGTQAFAEWLTGDKVKPWEKKTITEKVGHVLTGGIGEWLQDIEQLGRGDATEFVSTNRGMTTQALEQAKNVLEAQVASRQIPERARETKVKQIQSVNRILEERQKKAGVSMGLLTPETRNILTKKFGSVKVSMSPETLISAKESLIEKLPIARTKEEKEYIQRQIQLTDDFIQYRKQVGKDARVLPDAGVFKQDIDTSGLAAEPFTRLTQRQELPGTLATTPRVTGATQVLDSQQQIPVIINNTNTTNIPQPPPGVDRGLVIDDLGLMMMNSLVFEY